MKKQTFTLKPSHQSLTGIAQVPGDKSISHRAIMLGSLADGESQIRGFLNGDDCLATLRAFRHMGVDISINENDPTQVTIQGVGMQGLQAPTHDLDVGNSGTSIRLMAGILAAQNFTSTLTGDASLSKRPMRRVTDPLGQMGATISTQENGTPPLHIHGQTSLHGIQYALPMASAQVKSCLLLAGMYASGNTSITEPAPCRDHTERMLQTLHYPIDTSEPRCVRIEGGHTLHGGEILVPGDISSAAFLMVAASIAPSADITIQNVGVNPTRTGVIDILKRMGADIRLENQRAYGAEPVADIRVRAASLSGIDIPPELVPLAIDEFPCLFIAAACANGTTRLTEAAELRAKESDRIQVMADALTQLGIDCTPTPDGIEIIGGEFHAPNDTIPEIQTHHDHRIAMSMSLASLAGAPEFIIHDAQYVQTSFPGYFTLMQSLGMNISLMPSSP